MSTMMALREIDLVNDSIFGLTTTITTSIVYL